MPRKTLLALAIGILLTPVAVFAQNTIVTGQIRSNAQAPIPGAFVGIPSLALTTVANASGEYRFNIPADRVTGQEVTIEARSIPIEASRSRITAAWAPSE